MRCACDGGRTENPKLKDQSSKQAPMPKPPKASCPPESQDSGHCGKTVARTRLIAAHFSPSPGGEGRGEGGRFGSPLFHQQPIRGAESGFLSLCKAQKPAVIIGA